MKEKLKVTFYGGWLLPFIIAAFFIGMWLIDIVIPTLKGGDFNALYDLHGIRYLDITLVCSIIGFAWLGCVILKLTQLVTNGSITSRAS